MADVLECLKTIGKNWFQQKPYSSVKPPVCNSNPKTTPNPWVLVSLSFSGVDLVGIDRVLLKYLSRT